MSIMDDLRADPRRRTLAILAAAAAVSVLLAVLGVHHQSVTMGPKTQAETVFPKLPGEERKIARIRIVSKANGTLDIAFNPEKGWVLPQHANYPVSFEELNKTVVGIAALQTIEPATARPDWYGKVQVNPPPKGNGTLITLSDDKGDVLASVIAGKTMDIGDASGAVGLFIRKPGDRQSWLVRSVFEPKSDIGSWLDKTLLDVDRSRIQSTEVAPVTGAFYSATRDKPSDGFTLNGIPAGREIQYPGAADAVAAAITDFTFDDVRPATDFDFTNAPRVTTRTFDGLKVTVQVITQGKDFWATVYAEGTPGKMDAEHEARAIDQHANGWAYKLPAYKGQLMLTTLDSLLKPLPAKK